MKKIMITVGCLLLLCIWAGAQGIVGKWKRVSLITVNAAGARSDAMPELIASMPCTANIVYIFLPGGAMSSDASGCAAGFRKTVEKANASSKWSMKGNVVNVSMPGFPAHDEKVSFSGNTMTWEFVYADNPQVPNLNKDKKMITVYQRL